MSDFKFKSAIYRVRTYFVQKNGFFFLGTHMRDTLLRVHSVTLKKDHFETHSKNPYFNSMNVDHDIFSDAYIKWLNKHDLLRIFKFYISKLRII